MNIDRADLIALLRAKGLDAKADWVERQLPPLVDIDVNRALLEILEVDTAQLVAAKPPSA
jgi:hypothetical protein